MFVHVDIFNADLETVQSLLHIGYNLFLLTGDLNLFNLKHVQTNNFCNMLLNLTSTVTK